MDAPGASEVAGQETADRPVSGSVTRTPLRVWPPLLVTLKV